MLGLAFINTTHAPGKDLWRCGDNNGNDRQVLTVDGTNDYVKMDFYDDLEGKGSFTISFWINFTAAPSTVYIHQGDGVISDPPFLMFTKLAGSGADSGTDYIGLQESFAYVASERLDEGDDNIDLSESHSIGRWIHVLLRWNKDTDSGKFQYMLDGNNSNSGFDFRSTTSASTSDIPAMNGSEATQRMIVGGYYVNAIGEDPIGTDLQGKVADFALWDRRLEDHECHALAMGYLPSDIQGSSLQHYWPFSGDGEDYGSAGTRDEADATAQNDASFTGSP